MKIVKILILMSCIFLLLIPNALAATTSVTSAFDASEYYQGKSGSVEVWVTNNGQDYILLEKLWITFDNPVHPLELMQEARFTLGKYRLELRHQLL